jgi:hypothetical protein
MTGILLVAVAVVAAVPSAQEAKDTDGALIAAYIADAKAVARSRYDREFYLDTRDVEALAAILEERRARYSRAPQPKATVTAEVKRWGAVLGEIVRSKWEAAHWARAKEQNLEYGYSMYVPLDGGTWLECNIFDFVEGLLTRPRISKLTIEQALSLYIVD